MLNSVLVFVVLIIVAIIAFSLSIAGYYYDNMESGLLNKAKIATNFFAAYTTRSSAEYYDSIYKYTNEFDSAGTIELQFINTSGNVVTSSYGSAAGSHPGTEEIQSVLTNGATESFRGKNPNTGERIMAVSAPMKYTDGQVIGVMRYVTSLRVVDREIAVSVGAAVLVGAVIVAIIIITNMFFIRSVVEPVNEITHVARRIADGSYGIQIAKKYPDEIGEMVDAINEMSVKIGQTERTQSEFISSVSHELRTPLTAITGWGETLMFDENLDAETRGGIGIMLREARRLTKMVEELLDFTRIQDGRFTLNVRKIDVGAELEDSIYTYRELLHQDNIELEYHPPEGEMPIIDGDPDRLRQVFLNILDNASKYGREGKKIVVEIGSDENWVWIKIRDFGPGIPEEDLENVKKKFYKGKTKERGSGIGLAVVDEIVKYHNGVFTLENAEGGGLLATVRLPIDQRS
ncbi:MAG: HAMP domain-containing histidine kinase [Oscillospiraceae bacterium]|nr:HAMP domain-containing histidine kinase [Oscillospiraceae bacterium]